MRIARTYTIETDHINKLQEDNINASELINKLLHDYFSDDEDVLMQRLEKADRERNQLIFKLEQIKSTKLKAENASRKDKLVSDKARERKLMASSLRKAYREDLITEEAFLECFGKDGVIVSKAKALLRSN